MHSPTTKNVTVPSSPPVVVINPQEKGSLTAFVDVLSAFLEELSSTYAHLVILCIGSDRSTGDCLGPLVGSILEDLQINSVTVMGTLSKPVHALNIRDTKHLIEEEYPSPAILAVDACLGQKQMIGQLEIGKGSLLPGAAVKKRIPPIGNMFVTGIVNVGGFMELMVLQSTRLSVVIPLARFIGLGIFLAVSDWANNR